MLVVDREKKNKPLLLGGLSHELFHVWIGNKVQIPEPQDDLQSFFEGLNDFYGWQLALECGVISEKDYLTYYNRILKDYFVSPYRDDSNESIAKGFLVRSLASRLALNRSHIDFMEALERLKSQNKS